MNKAYAATAPSCRVLCGVTYEYAIVDAKASNLVIEQGSGDADDYDDVKLTVPIHVIQKHLHFNYCTTCHIMQ